MSIVADGTSALYAPAQDCALSHAGDEIRGSLEKALEPPRPSRSELFWTRLTLALRKGVASEGAMVSAEAFGKLCDFVSVLPSSFPVPHIVVESNHEIGLDWHEDARRTLSVTIDESSYVGFAALLGYEPIHGRTPFSGTIPVTIQYLLRRLYGDSPTAN